MLKLTELQRRGLLERAMRKLVATPRDPNVFHLPLIFGTIALELYGETYGREPQDEEELFLVAEIVTEAFNELFRQGDIMFNFKDWMVYYTPADPLPGLVM